MILRLLREESEGLLQRYSTEPKITSEMWSNAYVFAVSALIKTKVNDDVKYSLFSLKDPATGKLILVN